MSYNNINLLYTTFVIHHVFNSYIMCYVQRHISIVNFICNMFYCHITFSLTCYITCNNMLCYITCIHILYNMFYMLHCFVT